MHTSRKEKVNPTKLRTLQSDCARRGHFAGESKRWADRNHSNREPIGDFRAYVEFVDDITYQDMTKEQLLQLVSTDYAHSFIILVDRTAISSPEFPLLIVDLYDEPGREFRAIPTQVQGIENNLSIANMYFEEFADAVDEDGVFRGFFE